MKSVRLDHWLAVLAMVISPDALAGQGLVFSRCIPVSLEIRSWVGPLEDGKKLVEDRVFQGLLRSQAELVLSREGLLAHENDTRLKPQLEITAWGEGVLARGELIEVELRKVLRDPSTGQAGWATVWGITTHDRTLREFWQALDLFVMEYRQKNEGYCPKASSAGAPPSALPPPDRR